MAFPFMAVGAGLGLLGQIGKFVSGIKQSKEAKKINPVWQQYQTNPFARRQLETAQNAYADPSMGTRPGFQRNIFSNTANFIGNVNRNATDSSQALALGAAGLEQGNEAISNENMNFMRNKMGALQNLNQAYGTMVGEGDKEYQSMLQKFQMDAERKDALKSAGAQNKFGAISDLASMAFTAGTSGMFGGKGSKIPSGLGGSGAWSPPQSSVGSRLNWMGNQSRRWNPATGKFE